MDIIGKVKKAAKSFNEASLPKKAGIAGSAIGVTAGVAFFGHVLALGAIGGAAGFFGGKAHQKNNPKQ
jgi:hypothetical protein